MSEKKIPLAEATAEQIRAFGQTYLGLSFPANTREETMRAKVAAAWDKPDIIVDEAEPQATPQGATPPPVTDAQQPPKRKMVRVLIHRTDDDGGDEAVPLGVNGRVMLVPRGKEVDIPSTYYEVLRNAVTHRFESYKEGGINPVPREVPLYPHHVISMG